LQKRKGVEIARMPAGTRAYRNQTINTCLACLLRVATADNVMKNQAAIGMDGINHIANGTQRCNDNRHPMFDDAIEILSKARIGFMDDQINAEGRSLRLCR